MGHPLRLLGWNVNFRAGDTLERVLELAADHDVLALQEVTVEHAPEYRRGLEDAAFQVVYEPADGRYASLLASRLPCREDRARPALWPELAAHAALGEGAARLHVLSVHVPNGSGNGWRKIEWLDGLRQVVEAIEGPVVIAGDFNEPRFTWLEEGSVVTWGEEADGLGRYAPAHFHPRSGASWDASVRWFFGSGRLRHAFWETDGVVEFPETHRSGGVPRCFDHVLVSPDVKVTRFELMERTRPDFSDHSAVSVALVTPA